MSRRVIFLIVFIAAAHFSVAAQLYTGISGLINVPSAEMADAGEMQVGGYFMNRHFLPEGRSGQSWFSCGGKRYDTGDFYLGIAPFKWVEVSYVFTLMKSVAPGKTEPGYNQKDRYFAVKFRPLEEGRWYPSVAVGAVDFMALSIKKDNSGGTASGYFRNYYVAATKHFDVCDSEISANLAYRYVPSGKSGKWGGVVGGITWRPRWVPDLRTIAEWTGNEINIGADMLFWKHMFIQVALVDCRYFTGGLSFRVNLF